MSIRKRKPIKISKYIPICIILLSITIMIGSTFAYFTDKAGKDVSLSFSKVELSSETTVGYDGVIKDIIPGSAIVDNEIRFSKAIDSEAIYVRAKIGFSLPNEYVNDTKMKEFLFNLRTSSEFNIYNEEQNDAVWSAKDGDYVYLVNSVDTTTLKRVDTIDTYLLSEKIILPRNLEQLDEKYQYMKVINFHVAFEAIQADNVSNNKEETKYIFNEIFPRDEMEASKVIVTLKSFDLVNDLKKIELQVGDYFTSPQIEIPEDENGIPTLSIDGWYLDTNFSNEYLFRDHVIKDLTLYPKTTPILEGLEFIEIYEESELVAYSVAQGSCIQSEIPIPSYYKGLPVTEVADNGFSDNTNLTNIILPRTLTTIGDSAFAGCNGLGSILIPENVILIKEDAFKECTSLIRVVTSDIDNWFKIEFGNEYSNPLYYGKNLYISTNVSTYSLRNINNLVTIVETPSDISKINAYAFYNCESLQSILITSNITTIGRYAFYGCVNLGALKIEDGVKEIEDSAFEECNNLPTIELPPSVEDVGSGAIPEVDKIVIGTPNIDNGNTGTGDSGTVPPVDVNPEFINRITNGTTPKEIIFNIPVGTIGAGTFSGLNVGKVIFGKPITNIEPGAFTGTQIKLVEFKNVPSLPKDIFEGSGIEEVTLPDNLEEIGKDAFKDCKKLLRVNISSIEAWLKIVFENEYSNPIYYSKCLNLTGEMVDYIYVPKTITKINNYALINCESLESIVLTSNIQEIEEYAFYGCVNLMDVTNESEHFEIVRGATSNGYVAYYMKWNKNILAVKQTGVGNNSSLSKVGYNANILLSRSSTIYDTDGYNNVGVYKNIEIRALKVGTNEIVAVLNNGSYKDRGGLKVLNANDFPWNGTYDNGTEDVSDDIQVDIYTYYPTHYVGYIPDGNGNFYYVISEKELIGEIDIQEGLTLTANNMNTKKIDAYYRATFEGVYQKENGEYLTSVPASVVKDTDYGVVSSQIVELSYKFRSVAGQFVGMYMSPQNNKTIINNNMSENITYSLDDYRFMDYQILYLVKYANFQSQDTIGKGIATSHDLKISNIQAYNTGSSTYQGYGATPNRANCIALAGRDGYVGSNGLTPVWCLGISNPWGNVWKLQDGMVQGAGVIYYTEENCINITTEQQIKNSFKQYKLYSSSNKYNYRTDIYGEGVGQVDNPLLAANVNFNHSYDHFQLHTGSDLVYTIRSDYYGGDVSVGLFYSSNRGVTTYGICAVRLLVQ